MHGEPTVLNEQYPLSNPGEMLDADLVRIYDAWSELAQKAKGVPVWDVEFGLRVPSIMSRTFLFNMRGDDIYVSLIGEACREFIGLQHIKGPLEELIPEDNAKDIRNRVQKSAMQRAPNYCLKTLSSGHGRDYVKYEAMVLPFVDKNGKEPTWFFSPLAFHVKDET